MDNWISELWDRREPFPGIASEWYEVSSKPYFDENDLANWLSRCTTGRFHFTYQTLRFELEQDAIMFKLGYEGR